MNLELKKAVKGYWFWQKEWWWVMAINELIARKTKESSSDKVSFSIIEVNNMIDELGDSLRKRLCLFAKSPIRVSLKSPVNIEVTEK